MSCLEYEPTIPAKFMIGTDQGVALGCSRKAKCQPEYILNTYQAHFGPIRSLQRNPCYTKVNICQLYALLSFFILVDIFRTFLQLVTGVQGYGLRISMKAAYFWLILGQRSNQLKFFYIHIYLLFQMFRCLLMDAGVQPDLQYFSPPGLMAGWKLGTL